MIQESLKRVFEENNGVLTPEVASVYGIHNSTLRKAVERKDIQKYCKGIYFLNDVYFDDLYFVQLRYSKSVYSHETAVMLHTLSTYSPFFFHTSFPKGYHLPKAIVEEQRLQPYYMSKQELDEEYIEVIDSWDSNPIRVTNLEKTVVDMLRHKGPMPGIVDEMINDYIIRTNKDIDKLMNYGNQFGVVNLIKERILPFVKLTNMQKTQ